MTEAIPRPFPAESGWEALEQALGGLEDAGAVAFASGQVEPAGDLITDIGQALEVL